MTKSSRPKLSDIAKYVVVPDGVVATGWPAVERKCRDLDITFRSWQPDVGRLILAKRADGKYAATVGGTGISIPRQVGKTFLVAAIVFALCLLRPGLTVIWTSHRLRTSEQTFDKMKKMTRMPRIAPEVLKVWLGSGEESIEFRNGSKILFGARERGFGRGFDEVDVLIFDEAQILTENALDDMVPAANQSRQPTGALQLYMGTPPKPSDPGEVFARMRSEALSGEDQDTAWVELGADDGYVPTPLPAPLTADDLEQVAKANPSVPEDTPWEAIYRMRKKLGAASFLREGLGIWNTVKMDDVFGHGAWERCAASDDVEVELGAVAISANEDLSLVSLVGAGFNGDDVHGKPLQRTPGTAGAVTRAKTLQDKHGCPVVVDGRGPAAALIPFLEQAGVDVTVAKTDDVKDACSVLAERVRDHTMTHTDHTALNDQVENAHRKRSGDRWFLAGKAGADISLLKGLSLAVWVLTRPTDPVPVSAYEARGVLSV